MPRLPHKTPLDHRQRELTSAALSLAFATMDKATTMGILESHIKRLQRAAKVHCREVAVHKAGKVKKVDWFYAAELRTWIQVPDSAIRSIQGSMGSY